MLQAASIRGDEKGKPLLKACLPEQSTRTQLIQVFIKFAEANPARLHEEGAPMAFESIQLAFPCTKR
jgi:hypothetical protein